MDNVLNRIHGGYKYTYNRTVGNITFLRCSNYGIPCYGTAKMSDGVITPLNPHSHAADMLLEAKIIFKRELRFTVEHSNDARSIRDIYNSLSLLHPEAARVITFGTVSSSMNRWRRNFVPPRVTTLRRFHDILQAPAWAPRLSYARGEMAIRYVAGDNSAALLMYGRNFIMQFHEATTLYIDTTFKVTPDLENNHLSTMSIYAEERKHVYPIAWVILENKCSTIYERTLQELRAAIPELLPESIVAPFEQDLQEATAQVFPQATYKLCMTNFSQIILTKLHTDGNLRNNLDDPELKLLINKLIALPLLPAAEIPFAFQQIKENVNEELRIMARNIFRYFETEWILEITPETFSVFNDVQRMTTNVQRHQYMLLHYLSSLNPNIWKYHSAFMIILSISHNDLIRVRQNKLASRSPSVGYIVPKKSIQRLWDDYIAGNDILEFLEVAANLCNQIVIDLNFFRNHFRVVNEDGQIPDVGPNLQEDEVNINPPIENAAVEVNAYEGGGNYCIICRTNKRTVVLQPCNQLLICLDCFNGMLQASLDPAIDADGINYQHDLLLCPLCREIIIDHFETILPNHRIDGKQLLCCYNCENGQREIVFFPCKHLLQCNNCARQNNGYCDYCDVRIERTETVFVLNN